jgi:cadmium resistance protein CadD (predicted permease)
VFGVAVTTIANGGDNLSVYTPVFAAMSARALAIVCVVFALMVAAWLLAALAPTGHPVGAG